MRGQAVEQRLGLGHHPLGLGTAEVTGPPGGLPLVGVHEFGPRSFPHQHVQIMIAHLPDAAHSGDGRQVDVIIVFARAVKVVAADLKAQLGQQVGLPGPNTRVLDKRARHIQSSLVKLVNLHRTHAGIGVVLAQRQVMPLSFGGLGLRLFGPLRFTQLRCV